jgi:threonyl-tRNA synthetase
MFILGDQEKETHTVSIRSRRNKELEGTYEVTPALELIGEEIKSKRLFARS